MNLFLIFKLLPKVHLGFKDVSEAYKTETGDKRPSYLSRRFVGSVAALIGLLLTSLTDIKLDSTVLDGITINIDQMITLGLSLYGSILIIVGQIKRDKSRDTKK